MYWEETLLEMSATMRYGYANNPTVVPQVGNNHAFQNSYNVKYNFRITFVHSVRFNLVRLPAAGAQNVTTFVDAESDLQRRRRFFESGTPKFRI